jgi:pimeloyl-ACP methyl ester carboxylesterase
MKPEKPAGGNARRDRLRIGADLLEAAWRGPDAPPGLVLLHEGLGSVGLWRDWPQALAQATGRAVFAWSRAGYGRSDACALPRPLDYHEAEARLLPAVLDAAGARRCVLVGHSDGATIAALHAVGAADPRVAGLVLMAPHYFVGDICLAGLRAARQAWDAGGLRAGLARHHDHVEAAFHGWNDTWLDPDFRAWNVTARLSGLRVPALQIQGSADQYGTTAQTDALERAAPGLVETLVLPVGHAPHQQAPAAVLAAVAAFTRRLLGAPGSAQVEAEAH